VAGFISPPDQHGFNALTWEIVKQIPPGKVSTYGRIAAFIPPPPGMSEKDYRAFGARWVGRAMSACPENVPWQRVINAQGKISLPKGSGQESQKQLLEDEGIIFDSYDRVSLSRYGWEGPSKDFCEMHGLIWQGEVK
jgi:methylated-DNA-protein-cysteine methyltransferase-like protein